MKQNKLSKIFYLSTFMLVWFSFFLNNDSHSQSLELGRSFSKIFTNKDYNSSRINWCVIQDNRGIVYVGNENGILEFDGNSWRKIEVPNSEAVRTMDVADDGTIYLCAGNDFGYLEPNSKGLFEFKSLLPFLDEKYHNFGEMWDVATSSHGIYFKNSDKVFRWNGNDFMVWDSVYAFRLYNINDTIYSRNQDTGLMLVDGDSIKLMPDGKFFADTGVYNMLPFKKEGENSKILITTDRAGLFIHDGKKFSNFKTENDDFLTENRIYNACNMSDGKIAITTRRGGVVIINKDGKLQNKMNKSNGLPTNVIYDVWYDKRGGLWMASNNGVIYSEILSSFSILDKYILQEDVSNSVIRFNGNLYVANSIGILYSSEKTNSFELVKESKSQATSFLEANEVLLAITNDGIATIKDDEIIEKYYANVNTLYKSKYFKDRIYAGSNYGFFILEKGDDGLFTEKYSKDLFNLVTNFAEDSNGSLWIDGLFRGIYHLTGKLDELTSGLDSNVNYEYLTLNDGLPELKDGLFNIQDKVVLSTSKGMFLYSDSLNSFIRDSSLSSIFSDSTYSLSILGSSANNTLWMLRDSLGNKDFRKAKLNPNGKYTWELLPEFRRLDAKSINSVYHDFDKLTNEEILWVVSEESLFRYKENKSKNLQSDFNTLIRKVIVNNDSLVYGGAPFGTNLKDN